MAYLVRELITRAFYLSSVVARDLQTVSGEQVNDGLNMLNAIISFKTVQQNLIPYWSEYNFNAVIGQETYFIPNLITAEILTFSIQDVRYSTFPVKRVEYEGTSRANNVEALPYMFHVERKLNGADLSMYMLPQQAFPFILWGKFALADVTIDQDLSLTLDKYYIEYLRYALAEYICQEYNITFPPQSEAKLKEFEGMLIQVSPQDLSMQKMSSLQQRTGPDQYALANIAKGWLPG